LIDLSLSQRIQSKRAAIFMIPECKKQVIELPDRKEISLCEAVTAVIFGEALNVRQWSLRVEEHLSKIEPESLLGIFDQQTPANERIPAGEKTPANERIAPMERLLEALREAAYAGRVKFRAIKDYANPADGLKDIDPIYFYYKPAFNWQQDEIHLEDELSTVWSCVHLDREQFQLLLRQMDLESKQREDADETDRTGVPGRPPSIHLIIPEAQRRLSAEQHPKDLIAFGRELAHWFKQTYAPPMAPVQPTSLANALRKDWHAHKRVCTK
jgi:hypothetical protein